MEVSSNQLICKRGHHTVREGLEGAARAVAGKRALISQPYDLGRTITIALGAFVAGTVDDLMLLTVFFAESKAKQGSSLTAAQVCAGEFLGVTFLVVVSLVGYIAARYLSAKYIGLLGILPILMGFKQLINMCCQKGKKDDGVESVGGVVDVESVEAGQADREVDEVKQGEAVRPAEEGTGRKESLPSLLWKLTVVFSPGVLRVASSTIANGSDSVAVYAPLFAHTQGWKIVTTVAVFYIGTGLLCGLGYALVRTPFVAQCLEMHGRWVVPLLLIGLGCYIVLDSDTQMLVGLKPL